MIYLLGTAGHHIHLRTQHKNAASAPFLRNPPNCSELGPQTAAALASIPRGLKTENIEYPLLRIFASWKGAPKVDRLLQDRPRKKSTQRDEGPYDPDPHPLAYLDLGHFNKVGEEQKKRSFRRYPH